MSCENESEIIGSEHKENLLSSSDLDILEEIARAQCEHLTHEVSSIKSYFQENTLGNGYSDWRQHWQIQTTDDYHFCYPINEDEYRIYKSGLVPDWKTIDSYLFNGKFYQVFIDGVLRNEHLEDSPNRELSVYKSSLKQIEELGAVATKASMNLKKGLV